MRYFLILISVCLLFIGSADAQFLPQTEDIPLMSGLDLTDEVFSFDTPSGQILNFDAETNLKADEVQRFYQTTLATMGWNSQQPNTYQRGKDTLKITFPRAGRIHFDITLANGSVD